MIRRLINMIFGGADVTPPQTAGGTGILTTPWRSPGPHTDEVTALRVNALEKRLQKIEARLDAHDAEREAEEQALLEIQEIIRHGG